MKVFVLAVALSVAGTLWLGVPCSADPLPKGSVEETLVTTDGMTRNYQVFRPSDVPTTTRLPLVIMMHGYHQTGDYVDYYFKWDRIARTEHFVVVYPTGIEHSWNAGHCCGLAMGKKLDDVAFITQLAQTLAAASPSSPAGAIDAQRVFLAGYSNGAMLAYRVACESTFRFAAIASVAGALEAECPHFQPTSFLEVHGLGDTVVPIDGSSQHEANGTPFVHSAADTFAKFVTADRCAPLHSATEGAVTTAQTACADGHTLQLVTVAGATHAYPHPPASIDTTALVWAFFAKAAGLNASAHG